MWYLINFDCAHWKKAANIKWKTTKYKRLFQFVVNKAEYVSQNIHKTGRTTLTI